MAGNSAEASARLEPERFEIRIPSDTTQGLAVLERIMKALERLGYEGRDLFGARLSLEEAIVNAIKHGNHEDPKKMVRIRCDTNHERMIVEIEDEGTGFNPDELPDPTADEYIDRPCGRGVLLMRAYMSKVEFNARGNQVTLERIRTATA